MACRMSANSRGGLGNQSLVVRREALLVRHVARLMLGPECMWTSMIRVRYGLLSILTEGGARASQHSSAIWREMVPRVSNITYHMKWMIGDGRLINFMNDPWVSDVSLARWPTFIFMDVIDT